MKRGIYSLLLITLLIGCKRQPELRLNEFYGQAQGSTFSIKFLDVEERDFAASFDSIFQQIDNSMSTYQPSSIISRMNAGEAGLKPDKLFRAVLERSLVIASETDGLFDPTVGPLVALWGFGKDPHMAIDSNSLDSVKQLIGYTKLNYSDQMLSMPEGFRIDFNAIAQGYTVDVISGFLEEHGISRYMVEVGGEVRTHGINLQNEAWKIGVDKPSEEIDPSDRFQIILGLKDKALATSGNYRKFWVDQETGVKYAHTIDPSKGYPAMNTLLSATILADNAMDADAYATVCMVLGTERALEFIENKEGLEAYLIFGDEDGNWQTTQTSGFANYILE